MKKSLLRRMAPLVAGMLFVAPVISAVANYAYITNITWSGSSATVYVAHYPDYPSGYVEPREPFTEDDPPVANNYYWWFDGKRDYGQYSDGYTTAMVYYPGTTNDVAVYVYGTNNDYGWAIHYVSSKYIYNGP